MAGVERVFGLAAARRAGASRRSIRREPTRRVIVVDRPNAVQTEIRVGQLGIPRKQSRLPAARTWR